MFGLITTLGGLFLCPLLFGRRAVYSPLLARGQGGIHTTAALLRGLRESHVRALRLHGAPSSKPNAGEIARAMVQKDLIEFVHFVQEQMLASSREKRSASYGATPIS